MTRAKKGIDFEKALDQLEALVEQMEGGELTLEASLKAFEKGVTLTRECQEALNQAEQKVQMLLLDGDQLQLVDFDNEADENAE